MRTIMFFTALLIFIAGGVLITRQPSADAQLPLSPTAIDAESRFDAKIERVEDKLQVAESIKSESVKKPSVKRCVIKKGKSMCCSLSTVTIRGEAEVYQVPAMYYAGTAVVDSSDLVAAMLPELVYVDTLLPGKPAKHGVFKKIGDFITKQFKRHDQK